LRWFALKLCQKSQRSLNCTRRCNIKLLLEKYIANTLP